MKTQMKLWVLKRQGEDPGSALDEAAGFIVRARTEKEARAIVNASKEYGDEGPIWADKEKTSCKMLVQTGKPTILFRDFRAA